jgi:hypothetical protein
MRTEIYGVYSREYDITFIMEEKFTNDNEPVTLEVKGFYYGEPDDRFNKEYYGKTKCRFD